MLAVVGLGNPGAAYRNTRHNAGFMVLDGMVEGRYGSGAVSFLSESETNLRSFDLSDRVRKTAAPFVKLEGTLDSRRFLVVKPVTFMNESGKAVASLRTRGLVKDPAELLIVADDIDLPLGRLRLRDKGSAGGHNGLKSIIAALGTNEFVRLKIGVGPRPSGADTVDYVLGKFRPEEWEILEKTLKIASLVTEAWIADGMHGAHRVLSSALHTSETINRGEDDS